MLVLEGVPGLKDLKILKCPEPSCKRFFDNVADLNQHISKTGCHHGQQVQLQYIVEVRDVRVVAKEDKKFYPDNEPAL